MSESPPPSASTPEAKDPGLRDPGLRGLIGHAVFAGLSNFIPIPFVDDWVRDGIRRRLVRQELAVSPIELDADRVQVLACGYEPVTASGCVSGCFARVLKVPVDFVFKLVFKKILRKVVFVLAIKDAVDTFSAVFHEGFLIRHALGQDHVCVECLGPNRSFHDAVGLRRHVEAVRDEVDHRPVERMAMRAFQSSRRLLRQSASGLNKALRKLRRKGDLSDAEVFAQVDPKNEGLDSLIDELTEEIGGEASYLEDLKRRLDRRLAHGSEQEEQPA